MKRHLIIAALLIAIVATLAVSHGANNSPVSQQKPESVKETAQALLKRGLIVVKSPPKLGSANEVFQAENSIQSVNVPEYTYALFDFDSEWVENALPRDVLGAVLAQIEIELNRKVLSERELRSVSLDATFREFEKEVQEAWDGNKFKEFLENAPAILHRRIKESVEAQSVFLTIGMASKEFRAKVQNPTTIKEHQTFSVTIITSPPNGRVSIVPLTAYMVAKNKNLPIPWQSVVQQPLSISGTIRYKVVWPDGKTSENDTQPITKSGQIVVQ